MTATDPWLTVITVVRDDEQGFAQTAASVGKQSLAGVEWVVVDGSANRYSVPSIINSITTGIPQYIWQQPQGIYTAMNQGMDHANGEYLFFANAGDTFATHNVIAQLHEIIKSVQPKWIVGLVEIEESSGHIVVSSQWDFAKERDHFFSRGLFAPHQGTVARTSLVKECGGFDTTFDIAADYLWFLRLSVATQPFMTDLVIGRFVEGGVSTKHWRKSFAEFHRARRQVFKLRGIESVREYRNTATHFTKVASVKTLKRFGLFN